MFAQSLEITLNLAYNKAKSSHHEFLTIEHLMLSLLENPDAVEVLTACSADIQRLRTSLESPTKCEPEGQMLTLPEDGASGGTY